MTLDLSLLREYWSRTGYVDQSPESMMATDAHHSQLLKMHSLQYKCPFEHATEFCACPRHRQHESSFFIESAPIRWDFEPYSVCRRSW
jgi:hypothetical protein